MTCNRVGNENKIVLDILGIWAVKVPKPRLASLAWPDLESAILPQ